MAKEDTTEVLVGFRIEGDRAFNAAMDRASASLDKAGKAGKRASSDLKSSTAGWKDIREIADTVEETFEALGIPLDNAAQSIKKLAGTAGTFGGAATAMVAGVGLVGAAFGAASVAAVDLERSTRLLGQALNRLDFEQFGIGASNEDIRAIEGANRALDLLAVKADDVKVSLSADLAPAVKRASENIIALGDAVRGVSLEDFTNSALLGTIGLLPEAYGRVVESLTEVTVAENELVAAKKKDAQIDAQIKALDEERARKAKSIADDLKRFHAEEMARKAEWLKAQEAANTSLKLFVATTSLDLASGLDKVYLKFQQTNDQIQEWADAGGNADLVIEAVTLNLLALNAGLDELESHPKWTEIGVLPSSDEMAAMSEALAGVPAQYDQIVASLEEAASKVAPSFWLDQAEAAAHGMIALGTATADFFAGLQAQTTQDLIVTAENIRALEKVGDGSVKAMADAQFHAIMDSFRKEKAFAITTATIQALQAEAMTLASIPFPASLIPAAAVAINYAALINQIQAQEPPTIAHRGLSPDEFPATLQRGEGVLTRQGVHSVGGSSAVRQANRGQSPGQGRRGAYLDLTYAHRVFGRMLSDGTKMPGEIRDLFHSKSRPGKSGILAPKIDNAGV